VKLALTAIDPLDLVCEGEGPILIQDGSRDQVVRAPLSCAPCRRRPQGHR
jgi:hypothetical protein